MASDGVEITETFIDGEGADRTFCFQRKELQTQVDLLCNHPLLQGGLLRVHLLPYLVWLKIRHKEWNVAAVGNANTEFQLWVKKHRLPTKIEQNTAGTPIEHKGWDNPTTGKAVIWDFYQWAHKCGYETPNNIKDPEATKDAARNLVRDLREALWDYYRAKDDEIIITIPKTASAYQPRFERHPKQVSRGPMVALPLIPESSDPALRKLLKGTLYSYHMTLGRTGKPQWSYKALNFEPGPHETMIASAVNLPAAGGTPADRDQNQYYYEASLDHGHLVIHARRADDTADISIQLFPHSEGCNFPISGIDVIARTWKPGVAASSISILSRHKLQCACDIAEGEPITDPSKMQGLLKIWNDCVWSENANNLVQLPPPDLNLHPSWDKEVFNDLLNDIEPAGDGKADLKIMSSLFHNIVNLGLDGPLSRNCRIEILVMNPANDDLIRARYKLRKDFGRLGLRPEQKAKLDLKEQIEHLPRLPEILGINSGCVEVKLSDIMPCGFLVLTRKRVLLGAMLAHLPYDRGGPMVEATPDNTQLWSLLNADWEKRWADAKDPSKAGQESDSYERAVATGLRGATLEQLWDERECLAMLRRSPKDAAIRMFVSFFIKDIDLVGTVNRLLTEDDSKRTIEIMIMDPDAPHLLEMRYGTEARRFRKDTVTASVARADIRNQVETLKILNQEVRELAENNKEMNIGVLRVYLYDVVPTFIAYQSGDEALLGMLLIHGSANLGPMIRVNKEQQLWNVIRDNWNTVLEKRCRQVVGDPVDIKSSLWQ